MKFIENVLPIDTAKYNITLEKPTPSLDQNVTYMERYSLASKNGSLEVDCTYTNNILQFCLLYVKNGSIILKDNYINTSDALVDFLLKYQNYTNIDSSQLLKTVSELNSTSDIQFFFRQPNTSRKKWRISPRNADHIVHLALCPERM